ncbi:MAG: ankyrin repeat domain-containing protein [Candidatus Gastranaerophilales bacterium]|nr:ankyrin repeat domain-containing protein [Candidatus Gastranaerophilales bacterium]
MYKLIKNLILVVVVSAVTLPVFAENTEEYRCDLMMRGYEFSNNGLSEAIIKKDKEAVELFLKADININLPDNEGLNAMDRALKVNDEDTVLLISMAGGQTKNSLNKSSEEKQSSEPVKKPEVSAKKVSTENENIEKNFENFKTNRLCVAVNDGNLDMVAELGKNSIYLNMLTSEGLAPLHYAIFNNNPAMVHLLLNLGADVNILTDDGLTPLDIAVLNNQRIIAKELLESGGALSVNVAKELIKFGCKADFDEQFGLYDAEFEDIFATMAKIQNKIDVQNSNQ